MNRRTCGIAAVLLLLSATALRAGDDPASLLKAADALFAEHKYERARSLYERALANGAQFDADLPHARNLGLACLSSVPPDLAEGIKWLRIAVKLDPQAEGLRAQLAGALLRSGDADAAIDNYRTLVEAHPQSAEYVVGLAGALRQAGRSDAAITLLQRTTEQFPKLVPVRVEYARLLNFTKQFPEAKRQFLAVLAIEPENVIAQVGVAKATSFQGDQEAAIAMYDRILQRHPGLYDAIVGKAFSLLWSGQTGPARRLLEEGARRHPDDLEVREALASMPGEPAQATRPAPKFPAESAQRHRQMAAAEPYPRGADKAVPAEPRDQAAPPPPPTPESRARFILAALLAAAALAVLIAWRIHRRKRDLFATSQVPAAQFEAAPDDTLAGESTVEARESASLSGVSAQSELSPPETQPRLDEMAAASVATATSESSARPLENDTVVAGTRPQVLLVGGSDNLVELECRWLAALEVEIICECNWRRASVRLLNSPPELLVLNAITADGWTSARMFKWIAADRAHLRSRTIVILSTGRTGAEDEGAAPDARVLHEPFRVDEWQQAVQAILQPGTAPCSAATDQPPACHA